jgi:polysaccharide deacetylase family protein (PEP-CTERM system associated)
MGKSVKKYALLTFDIEEWFQVHNLNKAIPRQDWEKIESSVEKNTSVILEILSKQNVKATFFILGWVAEKFPELIKRINDYGHEIASHGYDHNLVYSQNYDTVQSDISRSKKILEDAISAEVVGYRAPSFSVDDKLIDILRDLSFLYDSSYNAFKLNQRYGSLTLLEKRNSKIIKFENGLFEIPVSSLKLFGATIPMGGGAYFRLLPFTIFSKLVNLKLNKDRLYNFYLHPWEFEPEQPRIKEIRLDYKIRHYYGLHKTAIKFEKLITYLKRKNCEIIPIKEYLKRKSDNI